ncbi:MAG: DUF4258 domain-containing protein [Marinobacterium sp.]|nr:DUF4258 domain-containing protein [Marinobacterium sp.]
MHRETRQTSTDNATADPVLILSDHAQQRCSQRGLSEHHINMALRYGRTIRSRRAVFKVIGRKEIERYAGQAPELRDLNGIQVVSSPEGVVLTAYRNRNLRQIRPSHRKHRNLH